MHANANKSRHFDLSVFHFSVKDIMDIHNECSFCHIIDSLLINCWVKVMVFPPDVHATLLSSHTIHYI